MTEQITLSQANAFARGSGPNAEAARQAVMAHRRGVARHLLTTPAETNALASKVPEVAALAGEPLPWDPNSEDMELAQAIQERWSAGPALSEVMAAMALMPAYVLPEFPLPRDVPQWLRPAYARFLLPFPLIFLRLGEADQYAAHCLRAMDALHAAIFDHQLPDAPDIAMAVYRANHSMIYFNERSLNPFFRKRALIIEWLLARQGRPLKWEPHDDESGRRIGILHNSLKPGTETYYLLAHLEGFELPGATITLYLLDGSLTPLSDIVARHVSEVVSLPADPRQAVERIRRDGLALCLITNNLTWGISAEAIIAAHRLARVQVATGGSPVTTGYSNVDIFLSSEGNDTDPNAGDDYTERLVRMPGGDGYFALNHDHDSQTVTCSRREIGVQDDQILFFSSSNYYKITPETLGTWCEILSQAPGAALLLMPFNPNWGDSYPSSLFAQRLRAAAAGHGIDGDRIKVLPRVPTRADLLAVMRLADIYLDSFPFPGACSLVDPMLAGLPIVAADGRKFRTGLAASMLRIEGLESAICADRAAYKDRAVRLAQDADFREFERETTRAAGDPALNCLSTEPFARRFASFCAEVIGAPSA